MLILPINCKVNKVIPKKAFYERIDISSKVKEKFINIIEKIIWLYKISEDTINIKKTENVEEIEVFRLELKKDEDVKDIIKIITKNIPYKILFIITFEEKKKYAIKYEDDIFITEWNENISININSLTLEELYKDLIRKINKIDNNNDLEIEINKAKKIEQINKDIERLESKLKKEKQFNLKVDINKEIINKKMELEELLNE